MIKAPYRNYLQADAALAERILSNCPQMVGWAKADRERFDRFLRDIDGKISNLTLIELVQSSWSVSGVRDPWSDIATKSGNFALGAPPKSLIEVTGVYNLSSMVANDYAPNALLTTIKQRNYGKAIERLEDICSKYIREPLPGVQKGGPLLHMDYDNDIVRVVDPASLAPAVYNPKDMMLHVQRAIAQRRALAAISKREEP